MSQLPPIYLEENEEVFGPIEDIDSRGNGNVPNTIKPEDEKPRFDVPSKQTDGKGPYAGSELLHMCSLESAGKSTEEKRGHTHTITTEFPICASEKKTKVEKLPTSDTSLQGSIFNSRQCSWCSDLEEHDGVPTEIPLAVVHCIQCDADLCDECRNEHNKCKGNKRHELTEIPAVVTPDHIGVSVQSSPQSGESSVDSSNQALPNRSQEISSSNAGKELNILLLGETGVGKSTFINALANYLDFETFDAAATQEKPLCLISTHFTVWGHTVSVECENNKTEGTDPALSGTLIPSSYLFKTETGGVRFIDSPGIYDTRGKDQEQFSFAELSSYLSEYKSIDGICILLKPDQQKLTDNFTVLIKRLLNYFSKDAMNNIVFCFSFAKNEMKRKCCETQTTVCRFLEENNIPIPSPKERFYYVDNESFKYLCAKFCKVEYDEDEIANFKRCWVQSKEEMCRLLNHFRTVKPYNYLDANSLHKYEKLLKRLTTPVGLVVLIIQENIELTKDRKSKLASLLVGSESLKETTKEITVENIDIKPVKYPFPRVVCKSERCQTCNDAEEANSLPREYCIEARDRTLMDKIKYAFRFMNTACGTCECVYKEHSIDSYRIQRYVVNITIRSFDNQIRDQNEEMMTMLKSLAALSQYISSNRLFRVEDTMNAFLVKLAKREKNKCEKLRVDNKLKMLEKVVKRNITACESVAKDSTPAADLNGIESRLCNLPINGAMFKEILEAEDFSLNTKAELLQNEHIVNKKTWNSWFTSPFSRKASPPAPETTMNIKQN